ncbi:MAG TPA: thiamine pyrophosphate-binding protein [Streptosporangiaceae bacterium]
MTPTGTDLGNPVGGGSAVRSGTGAELLVQAFIAAGVRHLFGVPGDTGVALYDALYDHTAEVRHVLARDERHAAVMADAYARVSRRPGVLEVSSGGGVTFAVGGLGEAYAASVPVLVVASDIHRGSRGTGALTEIDQVQLFAAVTKQAIVAERADGIPADVARALRLAVTGRPGPVALIVPEDVLDEQGSAQVTPFLAGPLLPAARQPADAAAVGRAAEVLAAARQPAVLAGSGVHCSGAYSELADLAEALGAAVATSIHGKGVLPDSSPWSLGVTGNNGGSDAAHEWLAAADAVLVVGSRANATDTDSFTAPPRSASVIGVDVEPSRIARNYPGALLLTGDAGTVLGQIRAALPETVAGMAGRRTRLAALRERQPTPAASASPGELPPGTLLADDVIGVLDSVFAERLAAAGPGHEPLVLADPGTPTPAVASRWPVRVPGRSVLVPRGHGPMGYAIPGAVGAAMAAPGRPVIALTADGSFAMCCGELETIARLGLPVIVVQLTNHSLGWIKMLQHLYHDGRYFGVDPGPIDAVAVARACGLRAHRPDSAGALRGQLSTALGDGKPLYLDIDVPHMIDVVPQVPAWHRALRGDRARPVY